MGEILQPHRFLRRKATTSRQHRDQWLFDERDENEPGRILFPAEKRKRSNPIWPLAESG